jgi:ParB family chromosome partitioning protein
MAKRGRDVLGKGIHALIAEYPQGVEESGSHLLEVPVTDIEPNPYQPRREFDDETLADLEASIREKGILQPVVLNRTAPNAYHLIAGERRWRAAQRAGLETVPAVIHEIDSPQELIELALIENIQREDLNAIEEAEGYQALISRHMMTQEEIAQRVGKERSTIANAVRLLKLPEQLQVSLRAGELQMGHARALVSLDEQSALELGRRCIKQQMTVRELEKAVRARSRGRSAKGGGKGASSGNGANHRDPTLSALEDKLRHRFATAVAIHHGDKKGRIEIEYYDDDDLERILELLLD